MSGKPLGLSILPALAALVFGLSPMAGGAAPPTIKDIQDAIKDVKDLACSSPKSTTAAEAYRKTAVKRYNSLLLQLKNALEARAAELRKLAAAPPAGVKADDLNRLADTDDQDALLLEKNRCSPPTAPSVPKPAGPPGPNPNFKSLTGQILFGSVREDDALTKTLDLEDLGTAAIDLQTFVIAPSGSGPFYLIANPCPVVLNPKDKCTITLGFSPDSQIPYNSLFSIQSKSGDTTYLDKVELLGLGQGTRAPVGLTSSVSEVQFGLHDVGTAATEQSIDIANGSSSDILLHVDDLVASAPFVVTANSCPDWSGASLKASGHCTIKLNYFPISAGPTKGGLKIRWKIKNAAGIEKQFENVIPLYGSGRDAGIKPAIHLLPRNIRFADQEVSSVSPEQTVEITNSGSVAVTNLRVDVSSSPRYFADGSSVDNEFAITSSPTPKVIDPNGHYDLKLVFKPQLANDVDGLVRVSWDSTDALGNTAHQEDRIDLYGKGTVADTIQLTNTTGVKGTPVTRVVAGVDVSGASSADAEQKYFVEALLDAPIGRRKDLVDPLDARFWGFLMPRVISLPQSGATVSSLTASGDFFSPALNLKTTEMVQGLDMLAGLEVAIIKPRQGIPFWSSYKNSRARIGASFFAGAGFTTPFSAAKTAAEFAVSADLKSQLKLPDNKTVAAFVLERSRFLRKYYAGVRLKSYFFSDRQAVPCGEVGHIYPCEAPLAFFPGTIDLSIGQDESVTAGHLSGWVFRLDSVYPLPFAPAVTIFGSIYSALRKNDPSFPTSLTLAPSANFTALSDPSVQILPLGLGNRDYYRLGLAVDLTAIFQLAKPKPK